MNTFNPDSTQPPRLVATTGLPPQRKMRLLLGCHPSVEAMGQPATKLDRRAAGLLCYLYLQGETPRAVLARLLWPDAPLATARNNLSQTLRRLTRILGAEAIITKPNMRLQRGRLDIHPALPMDDDSALPTLLEGLDFSDCPEFDGWLKSQQLHLNAAWQRRMEQRVSEAEARGDHRGAIRLCLMLRHADNLCEAHHLRLMHLYWQVGDRRAALTTARECRELLRQELGIAPSAQLVALERNLLKDDLPGPGDSFAHIAPTAWHSPIALVEREAIVKRLLATWKAGQSILIHGAPGVGKTRLLREVRERTGPWFHFCGLTGESTTAWSGLARCTRDIARAYPRPPVEHACEALLARLASPPAQAQMLGLRLSLTDVLRQCTAAGMTTLVCDGAELLDPASLSLLLSAASDLIHDRRLRLILAWRTGDVPGRIMKSLLALVEQHVATLIDIPPLSVAGTAALMESFDPEFSRLAEAAHRATGGNPRFLLELMNTLRCAGGIQPGVAHLPLPRIIQGMVRHRLAQLSPQALALARLLAVHGDSLTAERVGTRLGLRVDQLMAAWQELNLAHLVRGSGLADDFSRRVILNDIPPLLMQELTRQTGVVHCA